MHANEPNGKKRLLDIVSTLMDPRLNNAAGSSGAVSSSSSSCNSSGPALTATVALIIFLVNEAEVRSIKERRVIATRSHELSPCLHAWGARRW